MSFLWQLRFRRDLQTLALLSLPAHILMRTKSFTRLPWKKRRKLQEKLLQQTPSSLLSHSSEWVKISGCFCFLSKSLRQGEFKIWYCSTVVVALNLSKAVKSVMISFKPSMSFRQSPQLKNSFPLTSADKCLSFLYTLLTGTETTDFQTMFIFWKILSHSHVKNNWDHLLQKGKQVLKCFVGTSTTFESYYFERFREWKQLHASSSHVISESKSHTIHGRFT